MPWERIGAVGTGQMPHERAWILFCYELALSYLKFKCGEPPLGSSLDVMWTEHDLGEQPSLGVYYEFEPPRQYINRCEQELERFDSAVDWSKLQCPVEPHEDEHSYEDDEALTETGNAPDVDKKELEAETLSDQCICLGEDCEAAKHLIRQASDFTHLVDTSHFLVSLRRCPQCGQYFLTMFCERVDWVDGQDPQEWIAVPLTSEEVLKLQTADLRADEKAICTILSNDRIFLYHDMPKGRASTLMWRKGPLFVPWHE